MTTATKHKGMIFTGESVRSILAGVKTQTRRVMNPQPDFTYDNVDEDGKFWVADDAGDWHEWYPHRVGSVVYVKETWAPLRFDYDHEYGHCDDYWPATPAEVKSYQDRMAGTIDVYPRYGIVYSAEWSHEHPQDRGFRWWSPLMMPRWAARIWLRIVAVRAERVQEISEADAIAEGTQMPMDQLPKPIRQAAFSERTIYARLFNHINGKGAWERNDFVWVYQFERAEKPE